MKQGFSAFSRSHGFETSHWAERVFEPIAKRMPPEFREMGQKSLGLSHLRRCAIIRASPLFVQSMPITPEDRARENIDKLLTDAGWIVQDKCSTNLSAARGVAVREFPLKSGHGEADYLLFVDGAPIGVVEAKKEGDTLTGVELQTTKYSEGVPDHLTTPRRPLPFQYQSTGTETRFTNLLEPDGRHARHLD